MVQRRSVTLLNPTERTAPARQWLVRLIIAAMAVAGVGAALPLLHRPAVVSDVAVSAWVIVVAFAVAESFVAHVYINRQARTFSLSEIPFVLGLAYVSPIGLIAGRVLGSLFALVFVRRQPLVKLAFNLAYFTLDASLAIYVYRAALGSAAPHDPRGWLAAYAAMSVSLALGSLAISLVIGAAEGAWMRSPLESLLGMGSITAGLSTTLGLLVVAGLAPARVSEWLFLVASGMILVAYQSHARVRRRASHVAELYDFSKALASALSRGALDFALLELTSDLLRAEDAELILTDENRTALIRMQSGSVSVLHGDPAEVLLRTRRAALGTRSVVFVHDTLVAALRSGDDDLGTLCVSGRRGEVDQFSQDDLRLFETLSTHASISLRNFRLLERVRQEANERERQALHDALTGLPNRTLLDSELRNALATRRGDHSVVVMLVDLDRFKEVNDTLGHHQGDALLRLIATRILEVAVPGAVVARLGGDEFAIVLTTTMGRPEIKTAADALERRLLEPFVLADVELEVGCSIGIAIAPDDGADPATLLQRADVAMYAAKRGSNSSEFYDPSIDHATPQQLALAAELRRDIARGALLVEYQPKAALPSGDVVGVEALARWHHPQQGFISPETFIGIAERSGLIRSLTDHVLDVAIGQLAQWRATGLDLTLAVNISVRNLLDDSLPPTVANALARHRVPASSLTLEITESTLIADPARTIATLNRLSAMGVALAIDDFGTGYSSLSYLRRLPVDEIKIDKSFVQRMTADESDSVIVRSTIDLGHNLGLQVTAEGVEDGQTWQLLAAAGCDEAQGFFLRASGTGAQMTRWLRTRAADQAALRGLVEGADRDQPTTSTIATS
jgi:diguanylate cyclase (GGDEF)-like protein